MINFDLGGRAELNPNKIDLTVWTLTPGMPRSWPRVAISQNAACRLDKDKIICIGVKPNRSGGQ